MGQQHIRAGRNIKPDEIAAGQIAADAITSSELAADALSADAAGREAMATGYFNEATILAKFAAGSMTEANVDSVFAAASIDDNILKNLSTTRSLGGRDAGRSCVGYFYLTGVVSDADTVTINSRVYEFDTNSAITGNVSVDVSGDQTADAACTALAAAINADASRVVDAVVWTGNNDTTAGVTLIAKAAGASNYSLAKSAANGVVSASALVGAAAIANRDFRFGSYTVTAADVTALARSGGNEVVICGMCSTSAPTLLSLLVRTSAGVLKSLITGSATFVQANTNFYALVVDDPNAILASGDVITFSAAV